jgi:hypothetical protein
MATEDLDELLYVCTVEERSVNAKWPSVVAHGQCLTLSNLGASQALQREVNTKLTIILRTELKYPRDTDKTR